MLATRSETLSQSTIFRRLDRRTGPNGLAGKIVFLLNLRQRRHGVWRGLDGSRGQPGKMGESMADNVDGTLRFSEP